MGTSTVPVVSAHFRSLLSNAVNTTRRIPELSMGPFSVTRSNPTHQLSDPTRRITSGKIWTQSNTTNNGAYSLVVTYLYTQNLTRTFSQPSRKIKFNCSVQPNLV